MRRLQKILTLTIIILLYSCSESPIGYDGYYNYPLETGLLWNYKTIIQTKNFRPLNPNDPYTPDTIPRIEKTRILSEGKYTFENGTETFKLSELPVYNYNYKSTNYYISKPRELYRYAYKGQGTLVLPKTSENQIFLLNGKHFKNIHSLIDYVNGITNKYQDSLYIEPTPRLVYKYPFKPGSKWNFVDIEGAMKIDKEVIGKELVSVPTGIIQATLIKWYYYFYNQIKPENISVHEYVSEDGLIKRTFLIKNVAVTGPEYPSIKGYVDIVYDFELINIEKLYE